MLLADLRRDQLLARDREVLEHDARFPALPADVEVDVRELEEAHRVCLGDLALHHLARDLPRPQIQTAAARAFGDRVVQPHLPLPAEQVARLDPVVGHLIHHVLGLVDRDRRVGRADVDHPAGLSAVEVGEAFDRLGAVEREDRVQVRPKSAVACRDLPALALVGTEVLDVERLAVGDASSRFRVVWIANRPRSHAIQRRPSRSATAGSVPAPTKKSATRSPSLLEAG